MTPAAKVSEYLATHPVCMAALGIMPLVAGSHTFLTSVVMASGFALVLLFSTVSLSIMRKLIPHPNRLVFMLLLSSTWATILDLLLQTYVFELRMQVDIYFPLIAMNSLLLMTMEKDALAMPVVSITAKALTFACMPAVVCLANGALREWLFNGRLNINIQAAAGQQPPFAFSLPLIDTPAGAFIVTGCLLALGNIMAMRAMSGSPAAPDQPDTGK